MCLLPALALSFARSLPATAQTLLSEACGNWSGSEHTGFTFLARLAHNDDMARLTIWMGGPERPATIDDSPQFDNPTIAIGAFATKQELEVVETDDSSILQIVTEYADEEGSGRIVTQTQFIDNQFTVVGHDHRGECLGQPTESDVDLWSMTASEDGVTWQLEPVGFEALSASDWTWDAAFERGFCSRAE